MQMSSAFFNKDAHFYLQSFIARFTEQQSVTMTFISFLYINYLDDNTTSNVPKFAFDTKVFRKVNIDGDKQHLQNYLDTLLNDLKNG